MKYSTRPLKVTTADTAEQPASSTLPFPGIAACEALPQYATLPFRRTIRRRELHQMVPLSETTIYEMERRGEFPRRFNLTPRCVVWDLDEVERWIDARQRATLTGMAAKAVKPDVGLRKTRPVRTGSPQK
ncbi:AlpA family phage regulatory protein [Dickeya dianthicola]|uniref:Phage transcriptional regulator, AlpA n=2 Tax=Dickeya TaxID=204037 RepID=C6CPF0_DICC1|nr:MULTISPECIES: AlpA family phage regulatory protein [Dickeya]ACT06005.1 phage transcriptional regulator, AlpA [Dickeya chrysanthemi Ech1591]MZG23969.1 AlpA family phage regulatory protein [Dickeya dianthicola]MZI91264.1 AlpA family phage regulatory protein [Dickeya dianthicola]